MEKPVSMIKRLIKLLADGEVHSGEALGEALGVSRTAVWKQLKKVEELGIQIQSVKGQGYQLEGRLQLLEEDRIRSGLSDKAKQALTQLELFDQVDSTNTYLVNKAGESSIQGHVCLAEQQLSGRGRRGRSWLSPFGSNLYISIGWEFEGGLAALDGLSLAVGVSVVRGLKALVGDSNIKLKWPNDVLLSQRKLGGILVELQGDPQGKCQVVVGVGLNVQMGSHADALPDQPWAELSELGVSDRNLAASVVISAMVEGLLEFQLNGFASFHQEWTRLDACKDKSVNLITANSTLSGIARGVRADGAILIEHKDVVKPYHGGEISLRIAHDS